jgi:gamma-glutamyltranspeptidase/glutathione hydrolase
METHTNHYLKFDPLEYAYPSRRYATYGYKGMVAASAPTAAEAGMRILEEGGNAIDAAVASAASLTVVEPLATSIGSDAFAIVCFKGKLYGINASGRCPYSLTYDILHRQGYKHIPLHGVIPITVPGAPGAWAELSKRFGNNNLLKNLTPAIELAENGYAVSSKISYLWNRALNLFQSEKYDPLFRELFNIYTINGNAPNPGQVIRFPELAVTLSEIGATNAESFYSGNLTERIVDFIRNNQGFLKASDLETYTCEWVEPISTDYRGYTIYELPPNGHGLVVLLALNILENFDLINKESAESYHILIEAMKLAYEDGFKYIGDPDFMNVTPEQLLSKDYANSRSKLIDNTAKTHLPGNPKGSDTVYFCTADAEGNMVSMIQSHYQNFGSGVVIPGTGILMQDRGTNFNLNPYSVNCLGPGKRPYHTIIPGFLGQDGVPIGPFGVMGGFMQPQGHLQILTNLIDFHMNPQEALDAPRFQYIAGKTVEIESEVPEEILQQLKAMGHDITIKNDPSDFGRGQIIFRTPYESYIGATEPRTDGTIATW